MDQTDETRADSGAASYWIEKIRKEEKAHEKFRERAEKAEQDYYDELEGGKEHLFNLFHSTVNTLHSRLYSRAPAPDIRRRFDLDGPMGQAAKDAALLLERAIGYALDTTEFHSEADRCVHDFLVAGMGVPWVEYEAKVTEQELAPGVMAPAITLQRVHLAHVPWKRFHWEPGKPWRHVDWVARDHYLSKSEIAKQWPDADLSDFGTGASGGASKEAGDASKYATCYRVTEVYYRPTRTVYVIAWDLEQALEVRKDALGLEGFFPCPRPMFANLRSKDLCPTPDHWFNRKSYEYVNRLVQRIHSLTKQIKDVGFYDASLSELGNLTSKPDGTLLPVSNLAERLATTGNADFTKAIAKLPITEQVSVVRELQVLLAAEKARLDEVNGIADVIRGSTNPNETATAQQLKGNWANLRLARRTGEVTRCLRDAFRIIAEIISEHYTPQSLFLCTGMQVSPEVSQVLKSDLSRALAIDIETDSTVAVEDEEDKRQRVEFLNYVTPFLERLLPAATQGTLPADLVKQLLKFAVGSFKHGRPLLDAIEAAPDGAAQLAALQGQLQQMQQQMAGLQQQNQQLQGQVQQSDAMKMQADGAKAQAGVMKAQADTVKARAGIVQAERKDQIDAFKAETDRIALSQGVPAFNVM